MGEIVTVSKEFCGFELKCLLFDSEPWFKGKVVANALGYSDTDQALRKHVENDDKKKWVSFVPPHRRVQTAKTQTHGKHYL